MIRLLVILFSLWLAGCGWAAEPVEHNLDQYFLRLPTGLIASFDSNSGRLEMLRTEAIPRQGQSMAATSYHILRDKFIWDGTNFVLSTTVIGDQARYRLIAAAAETRSISIIEKLSVERGEQFVGMEHIALDEGGSITVSARKIDQFRMQTKLNVEFNNDKTVMIKTYGVFDRAWIMKSEGVDYLLLVFSASGSGGIYHMAYLVPLT